MAQSDLGEPRALGSMVGALGAVGEIERSSEMVEGGGHGSSLNRSMPGAAGFLILSQALLGPGPVRVLAVLRDDALRTQPACMGEDRRAVALEVLGNIGSRPAPWRGACASFALRSASGRGRQSSPSSSSTSKA